jgi:hypothetical protein
VRVASCSLIANCLLRRNHAISGFCHTDEALNNLLTDPTMFQARTLLLCGLSFLFLMIITFGAACK